MILLLFVFGLSLVFGFYFLAAGVLRLPSHGSSQGDCGTWERETEIYRIPGGQDGPFVGPFGKTYHFG